jgi:uncharacterized GH25 family protein
MQGDPIKRRIMWQAVVAMAAVGWLSSAAYSHEMWVEVSKSITEPGAEVSLTHYVGMNFKGDVQPYNPSAFAQYKVTTSSAQTPLSGHYGDIPTGWVKSVAAGLNIVSYHSLNFQLQFQEASKWQTYLEYEGLGEVAQLYRQKGFPQGGVKENYQRCARALIWGMPPSEASLAEVAKQDRPTGMPLELLVLENPLTSSSDRLKLQLIYLSEPIADIQVRVFYRSAKQQDKVVDQIARTDQNGSVTLPRFGPGDYLLNGVNRVPAAPGHQADWQRYRASLSFTLD